MSAVGGQGGRNIAGDPPWGSLQHGLPPQRTTVFPPRTKRLVRGCTDGVWFVCLSTGMWCACVCSVVWQVCVLCSCVASVVCAVSSVCDCGWSGTACECLYVCIYEHVWLYVPHICACNNGMCTVLVLVSACGTCVWLCL